MTRKKRRREDLPGSGAHLNDHIWSSFMQSSSDFLKWLRPRRPGSRLVGNQSRSLVPFRKSEQRNAYARDSQPGLQNTIRSSH